MITVCESQFEIDSLAVDKSLKQLGRFICLQGKYVDVRIRHDVSFAWMSAETRPDNALGRWYGRLLWINVKMELDYPETFGRDQVPVRLSIGHKSHKRLVKSGPR